jgi:DNA-binding YbaB/EbfC family protein
MARGFQGMPGGNMQAMARQAQKLQQKMLEMQEELESREYEATVGGGVVTAKVSGKKELLAITIKPEAVDPDDVEMLEDMVMAAVNEALRTASETTEREMGKLTGGLNIPGLF